VRVHLPGEPALLARDQAFLSGALEQPARTLARRRWGHGHWLR
jgi:hypothetical protein